MRAMIIVAIILGVLAGIYLYVMALCYLCDVYEQKKLAKQEAEEKRRREDLKRIIEETEMRRRAEMERRKKVAEERRRRGPIRAGKTFA